MTTDGADRVTDAKTALFTIRQNGRLKSWNQVARYLGINSANISHLMKRDTLLPRLDDALVAEGSLKPKAMLVEVPPCPNCGKVHVRHSCNRRRHRKPPRKFLAPLHDADAVLELLERHYPGVFIKQ